MTTLRLLLLLAVAGLGTQCTTSPADPGPVPVPSFEEASIAVLKEVTPLVAGNWTMERVYVHRQPYFMYPQPFPADTVLPQFATLALAYAPTGKPWDALHPTFEGTLTYKGTAYPVSFSLSATPGRVLRQEGPPALFLFGYKGPISLHPTTADEEFLQDIGLMNESFTLEVNQGQPTMTWRGQRQHLARIEFRK